MMKKVVALPPSGLLLSPAKWAELSGSCFGYSLYSFFTTCMPEADVVKKGVPPDMAIQDLQSRYESAHETGFKEFEDTRISVQYLYPPKTTKSFLQATIRSGKLNDSYPDNFIFYFSVNKTDAHAVCVLQSKDEGIAHIFDNLSTKKHERILLVEIPLALAKIMTNFFEEKNPGRADGNIWPQVITYIGPADAGIFQKKNPHKM